MKVENQCLLAALAAFAYEGKIVALEPFGSGHINDTYAVFVETQPKPKIGYILQRLNTNVFKHPQEVMENIMGVTEYLQKQLQENGQSPQRCVLHFLKTVEGETAFFDEQGMPWRSYCFVENSFCYDKSPNQQIFYESARAFGDFLNKLKDYPAETLHETIPHFHDTRRRFKALQQTVREDALGFAASCRAEIDFAFAREKDCGLLVDMLAEGALPLRVTHNDTKLNNILFDAATGEALCVIDLDTIMPGLSINDYGDSIRYGATTAAEDEQDLTKVNFSMDLFEAYTKGYLETAGEALTQNEKNLMPQGARLMTLECGMRFLADHLMGDTYFKVDYPGQNLDRCRTQFKLVRDMEACIVEMSSVVEKYS